MISNIALSPCPSKANMSTRGVMGGVNASPQFVQTVGIGKSDGTVTNTAHQGGIVSIVSHLSDLHFWGCS